MSDQISLPPLFRLIVQCEEPRKRRSPCWSVFACSREPSYCSSAGFKTAEDSQRGYDHGTFVPLKMIFPQADIPVVTLSLLSDLDPMVSPFFEVYKRSKGCSKDCNSVNVYLGIKAMQ